MQENKTEHKASATPEDAQETAVLNCRVRRQPASLANYHYYIEAGKKVYVTYRFPNGKIQVSTLENKYRCSEDYFTVPASFLSFEKGTH
jgi:hypothetical protein